MINDEYDPTSELLDCHSNRTLYLDYVEQSNVRIIQRMCTIIYRLLSELSATK